MLHAQTHPNSIVDGTGYHSYLCLACLKKCNTCEALTLFFDDLVGRGTCFQRY